LEVDWPEDPSYDHEPVTGPGPGRPGNPRPVRPRTDDQLALVEIRGLE
jgi:hypothetical protein